MKFKNLDITLEWTTISNLTNSLDFDSDKTLPSYNLSIEDDNGNMLIKKVNLRDYFSFVERYYAPIDPDYCIKPKLIVGVSKNAKKSIFKYHFDQNYLNYKEKQGKIGFSKKIFINVDYNNDGKADFTEEIEYAELEDLNKTLLFNKIYRSSDYVSLKFLINKTYFEEKEIYSFLIFSRVSNKFIKNKEITPLFVENIQDKWLDMNKNNVLLTVPFIDTDIVEISENLNIEILPLNYLQSEMYNFLKIRESQEDINAFYREFFPNQLFNIGKVYKSIQNNETAVFYQNYVYLFNKNSLETNSLQNDLSINDITFNKYFPLLNKNQLNKTLCLSEDLNTDDVLDNPYNLQKDYLGYYSKDLTNYEDVAIDLDYLQSQGLRSVKIVEIEELVNVCNIYVEFITNFHNNETFYIETSNNLKFYEKYKTTIENEEYITLVFKYSYSLEYLNQYLLQKPELNKNQIISEKDLINFSAKFIL